jgi:hypothetical protein
MKLMGFFIVLFFLILTPVNSFAAYNPLQNACNGNLTTNPAESSATCQENNKQNGSSTNPVLRIIREGANLIAALAGVVAVLTIIYAGFNMVTSSGNEEAVKSARSKIEGSLIGLIIIALAWLVVTVTVNLLK